ncbi:hypothetical protein DFH29DRAFT_775814, partial [Suillus ampliporus]
KTKTICSWLVNNPKAKAIITCHLSASVQQSVSSSHKITAHAAWKTLADHYRWQDIGLQYVTRLMKDTADASMCVGQLTMLHECLIHMGVMYSNEDIIYQLLHGLPHSGFW